MQKVDPFLFFTWQQVCCEVGGMMREGWKRFLDVYPVFCGKCHLSQSCDVKKKKEEMYEGFELTASLGS